MFSCLFIFSSYGYESLRQVLRILHLIKMFFLGSLQMVRSTRIRLCILVQGGNVDGDQNRRKHRNLLCPGQKQRVVLLLLSQHPRRTRYADPQVKL